MTTHAAQAANDDSAAEATATPSVEHFNDSVCKQIGKLVNHLPTTTTTPSTRTGSATEASSLRHAKIEQIDLDPGVKIVIKEFDGLVRMAYDPAQLNALDARLLANIYVDFTEGEQVDGLRELGRNAESDGLREMCSIMLDQIDRSGDAKGVIARVVKLFGHASTEAGVAASVACARYSWCTETGQHAEHTGQTITANCTDAYGNEVLHATLMDWRGGDVRVGFLELDLTPTDARVTLTKLRTHLDAVEELLNTAGEGQ